MDMNRNEYIKYSKRHSKKSPVIADCAKAFFVGGFLCACAEALSMLFLSLGIDGNTAKSLVPITFIFLAGLLTGIGVFDDIARFAGAGTLVPITGFANSIVASAIDDKSEGFILGVGAKMFTVAGPVIVYGTLSSVIYGVIYWLAGVIF